MDRIGEELQDFMNGIAASVALILVNDDGLAVSSCNEIFFDMMGAKRNSIHRYPFSLEAIVPNYARRELRLAVINCLADGVSHELEQAYDLKDGTHWWRLSLKPFKNSASSETPEGVFITGIEITKKMLLMHDLEVSTSRFRSVVDAAYDAIITIDQQHHITLFNRAAEGLFGYDQEEMLDKPLEVLLPPAARAGHRGYVHQFARSPVRSRQMDERNRIYGLHKDGTRIPVEIAISKITVNGLVEFTAIIRDITDKVHLVDLLHRQAAVDDLTGLPNRREFNDVARSLFETDNPLSILMMDLDNFKLVNDTYGHEGGDDVLKAFSSIARETIGKEHIVARLGGEEFVACLVNTNKEEALLIAENLRKKISDREFSYAWPEDRAIPFTLSIGVAVKGAKDREMANLLKRADEGLYLAKENGRNRVEAIG